VPARVAGQSTILVCAVNATGRAGLRLQGVRAGMAPLPAERDQAAKRAGDTVRRAAKVDLNQFEIVRVAEQLGCTVQPLYQFGKGCPDLLIGHAGKRGRVNLLIEIKSEGGTLTPEQVKFHREWRGQVAIVRCVNDLLDLLRR